MQKQAQAVIDARNLTRHFGALAAIRDLTFAVAQGEILGLLGPNGAGKSTTMRILATCLPPTSGSAAVAGHDIFSESMEVRKRIGYLPESPPLYLDMTVATFLDFVAKIKGIPRPRRRHALDQAIEKTGLALVRDRYIRFLSKGFKQRVGLAQAIVHEPEVLILDEPTAGLDPHQIMEVRELIRSLAGHHTIILSTHILPEVEMTCDRVVIINNGEVVAMDTPNNLASLLQGGERIVLEVEGPPAAIRDMLARLPGVKTVLGGNGAAESGRYRFTVETRAGDEVRRELSRRIVERGWGLFELRRAAYSLEDVFIKLTTSE